MKQDGTTIFLLRGGGFLQIMLLDALVFDWSGVISDDRTPVYVANMMVLEDHGRPTMSFKEWLPRTTMTPIEFFRNNGIQDDADKLFALYKKYFTEAHESGINPVVYPDVAETLKFLRSKGGLLGILSSHPAENLAREAGLYGLEGFFDFFEGNSRDKSAGLLSICAKKALSPGRTLYTGDTIYDIQAAKKAGVVSAGICTGYHVRGRLEAETPDFLFETFSDIKKVV